MPEKWVQEDIAAARQILRSVDPLVPVDRMTGISELLDSDEPQEALLSLTWILGAGERAVPDGAASLIRAQVGHLPGVHPRFRS